MLRDRLPNCMRIAAAVPAARFPCGRAGTVRPSGNNEDMCRPTRASEISDSPFANRPAYLNTIHFLHLSLQFFSRGLPRRWISWTFGLLRPGHLPNPPALTTHGGAADGRRDDSPSPHRGSAPMREIGELCREIAGLRVRNTVLCTASLRVGWSLDLDTEFNEIAGSA